MYICIIAYLYLKSRFLLLVDSPSGLSWARGLTSKDHKSSTSRKLTNRSAAFGHPSQIDCNPGVCNNWSTVIQFSYTWSVSSSTIKPNSTSNSWVYSLRCISAVVYYDSADFFTFIDFYFRIRFQLGNRQHKHCWFNFN